MKNKVFERKKPEGYQPTELDIDILKYVYKYRFLNTRHILSITGIKHVQTLNLRLRKLYDNKYLDRPTSQVADWKIGKGKSPMVYGLGNKGAKFLGKNFNWYIPSTGYQTEKNRRVGALFIQHTIEIADFMIAIERKCLDDPNLRFISLDEIIAVAPEKIQRSSYYSKWPTQIRWNGQKSKINIIPDQIFGIQYLDKPDGKNKAYFFLEADRGTMPLSRKKITQTSFLRKLLSYRDTYQNQLHTKYLGIKKFRVLTITSSKERLQNIISICDTNLLDIPNGLFLFTYAETLHSENPLNLAWLDSNSNEKFLVSPAN